ncbi:MAG: CRISPR-associated endonuclease Cas2 [Actinomycetia bacterium]|nr:CRISPR-associated endonuclease Cas2 [Actinomycetes bacterium]
MDIVVAYDIAETEGPGALRLRQIADTCEKYGERVQQSVFECRLSPERYTLLLTELEEAIHPEQDSVLIYRFAGQIQEAKTTLGRKQQHELGQPWML